MKPSILLALAGSLVAISLGAQTAPAAWSAEQVQGVLERTARTRLAPDLSHLTAGERQAMSNLIEVGHLFQSLYENQRHRRALAAKAVLERQRDDVRARDLLTLYDLFQGPIATTLENTREAFVRIEMAPLGKTSTRGT